MQTVGTISAYIEGLLGITVSGDRHIYCSNTNLAHMKSSHPADFARYGGQLQNILANPDYVGLNPKDGSVEYVKEFVSNGEYVKVAVRVSGGGKYYARSLYVLNSRRVVSFINRGTLKKT